MIKRIDSILNLYGVTIPWKLMEKSFLITVIITTVKFEIT